jgi:hypothetical protein
MERYTLVSFFVFADAYAYAFVFVFVFVKMGTVYDFCAGIIILAYTLFILCLRSSMMAESLSI